MTSGVVAEEMRVQSDDVVLAGSLWLPSEPIRSIVVMHPGSGPSDRHNDVHFPPIRASLLAANHGVASFDKRGVGESTGSLRTTSIEQQAGDLVRCALAILEGHAVPLGAFGHSQGGWVVFEALGTTDVFSFGIANSGPGVSPAAQERHALAEATTSGAERDSVLELFDDLIARASRGERLDEVRRAVEPEGTGQLTGFAAGVLSSEADWDLTSRLMAYDPAAALERIDVPLLAVYGAADPIVPIDASIAALEERVSSELLEVEVFRAAGHRIEDATSGELATGYLERITEFATACAA